MFKVDRRFVKLSGTTIKKLASNDTDDGTETDETDSGADGMMERATLQREYLSEIEAESDQKVKQMLEEAHEKAETIIKIAEIEAEEARKRGWDEGYAKGVSEGKLEYDEKTEAIVRETEQKLETKLRETEQKLEAKIREDDEQLRNVLSELSSELERIDSQLDDQVAKLSLEIVRKIIGPAEDELGNVFATLIKNTLRQVSTEGKIALRVSQNEYERFFSSGSAVIELDNGVKVNASVLRDVTMNEGDLIIDTDEVTINAGIETQLKYVELAFERADIYEPD